MIRLSALTCALFLCGLAAVALADPPVPEEVVGLARQFLATTDPAARKELAATLDASPADPVQVVLALRPKPATEVKAGYFPNEQFQTPELREKYPDDLLFYVVPDSYDPDKPNGLIVMMHGGGAGSKRDAPDRYMQLPKTGNAIGGEFADAGLIAVGPSAPWNEKNHSRWCLPEADDYIRDVILDLQNRFNIDPDRVFLMGHSMGGFGAFHQVQRQPDRFASVVASAGNWTLAYWPVIRGTPFWIVHGANDAEPGKRPHFTDVGYARLADKLLTEQGIPHEYHEHPGTHALDDAREIVRELLKRMASTKRDPYHPHVVAVTPRGYSSSCRYEAPHNWWVTILETTDGKLTFDALQSKGARQSHDMPIENWTGWTLEHSRRELPGAMVEAINRGDNRIDVTARNVRRFALWLHPKMVDSAKPVTITVNGKVAFEDIAKPSISTALRSFERRRDWGLIYPAEIELAVETSKE